MHRPSGPPVASFPAHPSSPSPAGTSEREITGDKNDDHSRRRPYTDRRPRRTFQPDGSLPEMSDPHLFSAKRFRPLDHGYDASHRPMSRVEARCAQCAHRLVYQGEDSKGHGLAERGRGQLRNGMDGKEGDGRDGDSYRPGEQHRSMLQDSSEDFVEHVRNGILSLSPDREEEEDSVEEKEEEEWDGTEEEGRCPRRGFEDKERKKGTREPAWRGRGEAGGCEREAKRIVDSEVEACGPCPPPRRYPVSEESAGRESASGSVFSSYYHGKGENHALRETSPRGPAGAKRMMRIYAPPPSSPSCPPLHRRPRPRCLSSPSPSPPFPSLLSLTRSHVPTRPKPRGRGRWWLLRWRPLPSWFGRHSRPWVLRQDSPWKRAWDMLTVLVALLVLCYDAASLVHLHPGPFPPGPIPSSPPSAPPSSASFQASPSPAPSPLDATSLYHLLLLETFWFLADLALAFRTEVEAGVDSEAETETLVLLTDPHAIAVQYLTRDFWLDLCFSFPWLAISALLLAPKQKKRNLLRRAIGHVGRGVGGLLGRVKRGVGEKIPRMLRPGNVKRFLEWTKVLDVKKVDGVKHVVKYRSGYRGLRLFIRALRWLCRFPVVSFLWRVYRKLEAHLVVALPDGEGGEEERKTPGKVWRARHTRSRGTHASTRQEDYEVKFREKANRKFHTGEVDREAIGGHEHVKEKWPETTWFE